MISGRELLTRLEIARRLPNAVSTSASGELYRDALDAIEYLLWTTEYIGKLIDEHRHQSVRDNGFEAEDLLSRIHAATKRVLLPFQAPDDKDR